MKIKWGNATNIINKLEENLFRQKDMRSVQTLGRQAVIRSHLSLSAALKPDQIDLLDEFRTQRRWLLIILDACRYREFASLTAEYLDCSISACVSEGSNTFEYVRNCWPHEHDVTYITGAPPITTQKFDFSNEELQAQGLMFDNDKLQELYQGYRPVDHISNIIEVWQTDWDSKLKVCPPEPVTDAAINVETGTDHLVVHYFQPHTPFIGEKSKISDVDVPDQLQGGAIDFGIWEAVKAGKISHERLHELYRSNLHRVLGEVARLIHKTEFENIAIMGDHGEALGEYGKYGHSHGYHPFVRIVPWAKVNKVNLIPERQYKGNNPDDMTETVETRLAELGYME